MSYTTHACLVILCSCAGIPGYRVSVTVRYFVSSLSYCYVHTLLTDSVDGWCGRCSIAVSRCRSCWLQPLSGGYLVVAVPCPCMCVVQASVLLVMIYTYLLTELSPSWGATNCAAPQEPPSISWNQKVQYRVHKSPPLVPILSHINPIHSIPSYLSKIHFNIVHASTSWSSQWSLSFWLSHQYPILRVIVIKDENNNFCVWAVLVRLGSHSARRYPARSAASSSGLTSYFERFWKMKSSKIAVLKLAICVLINFFWVIETQIINSTLH
jgi:hypothetical protein